MYVFRNEFLCFFFFNFLNSSWVIPLKTKISFVLFVTQTSNDTSLLISNKEFLKKNKYLGPNEPRLKFTLEFNIYLCRIGRIICILISFEVFVTCFNDLFLR